MIRSLFVLIIASLFNMSGNAALPQFIAESSAHGQTHEPAYIEIEDKAKTEVLTPEFFHRKVEKVRLRNGLEAYLVSDPTADKSSAALAVKTGSWEDPKEYPGIAHFLEHMLFLGTKKYPVESSFDRYISEHGGMSNAFTANDFTAYLFTVDHEAMDGALDRFSSFFKEPLFNPSGVARELNAIDQEYAKNIEDDNIREIYVLKELGNPSHPNAGFNMGNSATLSKVSQETLRNWWENHYSANIMKLIIVSPKPINKIREMALQHFMGIKNNHRKPLEVKANPLSATTKDKVIYIEPIKSERSLSIFWNMPYGFTAANGNDSEKMICHILGHEGEGSLLAQLKKERLANTLQCGISRQSGVDQQIYVEVGLTNEGLRRWNTVVERVYQALASIREQPLPKYLNNELHTMSLLSYQYQSRGDAFQNVMNAIIEIIDENLSTYPEKSRLFHSTDEGKVKTLLTAMTPDRGRYIILAPQKETGIAPERQERWIGVNYAVKPIAPKVLQSWSHAIGNAAIKLPPLNLFIPQNLHLVAAIVNGCHLGDCAPPSEVRDPIPAPKLLVDDAHGKIYFTQDELYLTPRISWYFEVKTPQIAAGDAAKVVMADLYVKALEDALTQYTYPAQMAGLHYAIKLNDNGIKIDIGGYSDKAILLFEKIVTQLKNVRPSEASFKVYKDELLRSYLNDAKESPLRQAMQLFKGVYYKNFSTAAQKAAALRKVNYRSFLAYSQHLFEQNWSDGVIYGNISEEDAKKVVDTLFKTLGGEPYPDSEQLKKTVIVLPEEQGPFFIEEKSNVQGNAAILAINGGPFSYKARAAQQILMQGLRDSFFATLRTKQQTGYIVHSSAEEVENHLVDLFAVQSNTHATKDLLGRFELFLEAFLSELTTKEIPQERFETIRSALKMELEQSPKDMEEMGQVLEKLAFTYNGDFSRRAKRIKAFNDLTYDEFVDYARKTLGRQNKSRIAILFTGQTPSDRKFDYQKRTIAELRAASSYEGILEKDRDQSDLRDLRD